MDYTVLALYGVNGDRASLEAFWVRVVDWLGSVGVMPQNASIHGKGFSKRITSFSSADATLRKKGYGNVTDLNLFSLGPDSQIPVDDYHAMACYSIPGKYALVAFRTSIASLGCDRSRSLLLMLTETTQPAYGIGFLRRQELGPAMYAVGICQGLGVGLKGPAYEEALEISRWGTIGMSDEVYRKGIIRGIYPWNILRESHLSQLVNGVPLGHWIGEDCSRGTLIDISDSLRLWTVLSPLAPSDQSALEQSGIVFRSSR